MGKPVSDELSLPSSSSGVGVDQTSETQSSRKNTNNNTKETKSKGNNGKSSPDGGISFRTSQGIAHPIEGAFALEDDSSSEDEDQESCVSPLASEDVKPVLGEMSLPGSSSAVGVDQTSEMRSSRKKPKKEKKEKKEKKSKGDRKEAHPDESIPLNRIDDSLSLNRIDDSLPLRVTQYLARSDDSISPRRPQGIADPIEGFFDSDDDSSSAEEGDTSPVSSRLIGVARPLPGDGRSIPIPSGPVNNAHAAETQANQKKAKKEKKEKKD